MKTMDLLEELSKKSRIMHDIGEGILEIYGRNDTWTSHLLRTAEYLERLAARIKDATNEEAQALKHRKQAISDRVAKERQE
jgi:hypothetical protein